MLLKFNDIIPDDCNVLSLSGIFNQEINRIRKAYLDLFESLSKKHNSLEWWMSFIASKNCSSIPLQLNVTYLFCAINIIKEHSCESKQKRIIFIADSKALINVIESFAKKNGLSTYNPKKVYYRTIDNLKIFTFYFGKVGLFLWQTIRFKIASKHLKRLPLKSLDKTKTILIRSWITSGTLSLNGDYSDRNFGSLPKWFKSKNYQVFILPMYFNINMPIVNLFSLIKKQNVKFLIAEHYLKFIDYVKAIYTGWKILMIPLKDIYLDGTDVTKIFVEVQRLEGFSNGTLHSYLVYALLKRMKESEFKIDKFYYPFENNSNEKSFILGCKKFFRESEIVAFQHTAWYDNQLGMFLGKNEYKHHPIADKIITSGPIYLDIIKNAGFPEKLIFEGPNLRFKSVHDKIPGKKKLNEKTNILIPLTVDKNRAYDMLHKVKVISDSLTQVSFFIRRHPLLNYEDLNFFLKKIEFESFQYADKGTLNDWLSNTDLILTSGATILIVEAVCMGIPVIKIEPDNNFLLDPIFWTDYPIKSVNKHHEILEAIEKIFNMTNNEKEEFEKLGNQLSLNYFSKVDNNNISVFE